MTFLLEELKELRKMVGMKKGGESAKQFWGCTQCLSNPTVWKDTSGNHTLLLITVAISIMCNGVICKCKKRYLKLSQFSWSMWTVQF